MGLKMKNDNKGFTLVELIVSVVILALVVAPFLNGFIVAQKTNFEAKKRQEGTELSSYIIEYMKATSLDKLKDSLQYEATTDSNGRNCLEFTFNNNDIPKTFSDSMTAKVKLTPSASKINGNVTPEFASLDSTRCAIVMKDFFKNDNSHPAATRRVTTIDIGRNDAESDSRPYYIKVSVEYFKDYQSIGIYSDMTKLRYPSIPDLYMMYTPLGAEDSIVINNGITEALSNSEDGKLVNVYLIQQKKYVEEAAVQNLDPAYVKINSADNVGNLSVRTDLASLISSAELDENENYVYKTGITRIQTNLDAGVTDNNLVKNKKVDTLYDMNVVVYRNGKKVANVTASKNRDN